MFKYDFEYIRKSDPVVVIGAHRFEWVSIFRIWTFTSHEWE